MSRSLYAAILGAALFTGTMAIGTTGAMAAPLSGTAGYGAASLVETVQYDRRGRRCRWVRRKVRSEYGWRWKRVRVCTPRRRGRRDY